MWHWERHGRVVAKIRDDDGRFYGPTAEAVIAFYSESEAIRGLEILERYRTRIEELEKEQDGRD